jgi:ribosome-binding protein aMBF1 (putative translation factor)
MLAYHTRLHIAITNITIRNHFYCEMPHNVIKRMMIEMYKEQFASRLKKARERTGLTQREVSKETHISQPAIAQYESGTREPNIEIIGTLAEFYGVSTDWLLGLGMQPGNKPNYDTVKKTEMKKIAT